MKSKKKRSDKYERNAEGRLIGERPGVRDKPGRHMGADFGHGYTLREDGTYEISPGRAREIESVLSEIEAIKELTRHIFDHIFDHAQSQLATLTARKTEWWTKVAAELYRKSDTDLMAYSYGGIVSFATRQQEKKSETKG